MRAIVTLSGIDEAINNLGYSNERLIKTRVIRALRQFYSDENSVHTVARIDPDDLIKLIWDTDNAIESVKNKRKNFSSIKSSINSELTRLHSEGRNPEGIVIGKNNTFDMSEKAKSELLENFTGGGNGDSIIPLGKINDVLGVVNEILKKSRSGAGSDSQEDRNSLDQLKELIQSISQKIGLPYGTGNDLSTHPSQEKNPSLGSENGKGTGPTVCTNDEEGFNAGPPGTGGGTQKTGLTKDLKETYTLDDPEKIDVIEIPEEGLEATDDLEEIEEIDSPEADLEVEALEETDVEDLAEEELEEADDIDEVEDELEEVDELPVEEIEDDLEEADTGLAEAYPEEVPSDETEPVDELETQDIPEDDLEEIEEIDSLEADRETEALEEVDADDLEEEDPEETDVEDLAEEELEEADDIDEVEDELEEVDELPVEEIEDDLEEAAEINNERLLADEFNNMLSDMDRFYNQYILVPKGRYLIGEKDARRDRNTAERADLKEFYFGKFPVTNALFEIFVERTGYVTTAEKIGHGTVYYGRYQNSVDIKTGLKTLNWNSALETRVVEGACWYQPSGPGSTLYSKRNHPVVQVSLEDASAFAKWTGKRIPTEAQWEAATRTLNGHRHPWGKEFNKECCNIEDSGIGDTTPVDKYPESGNSLGIMDILGNVMEWTVDSPPPSSGEGHGSLCIVKGGSWISGNDLSLYGRSLSERYSASNILGFRCIAY